METTQLRQAFPVARRRDLLGLAMQFAAAFVRRPRGFDGGAVVQQWMDGMRRTHRSDHLMLSLLGKKILLVNGRRFSDHILSRTPNDTEFEPGSMKYEAMSFLAPGALTIASGPTWTQLRAFNEQVLCTGAEHAYAQAFLEEIHAAFPEAVAGVEDIRTSMGRAMAGIVFGRGNVPPHVVDDIQRLFDAVQNPLKRKLFGFRYARRLDRLYDAIHANLKEGGSGTQPSLLGMVRRLQPDLSATAIAHQIPHWMFTFTGSGTDLLARTLAMICARRAVFDKAADEIENAGPLDEASTIARLSYLEACLLETGRLFPPVTRTFHRSSRATSFEHHAIPEGTELVQLFTLLQRGSGDRSEETFRPERWMGSGADASDVYSNLFLRGPRTCPGRDLIIFVCKSAAALQVGRYGLKPSRTVLSRDPLPISFPRRSLRYQT